MARRTESDIPERIVALQEQVTEAERSVAELKGRRDEKLEELKKEFNVSSVKEAVRKMKEMEAEVEEDEAAVRGMLSELEGIIEESQA